MLFVLESFCDKTAGVWALIGKIINIIRIAIPVIIVLLGTIDLGKAVIGGDEKTIKEAQGTLIKRIIYGVAIFFVFVIVQAIFGLVAEKAVSNSSKCWACVSDPNDKGCDTNLQQNVDDPDL